MNKIKEYNRTKEMVLTTTEKSDWKTLKIDIIMLDTFVSMWAEDENLSLRRSQSLKTYRDIIVNSETPEELNALLKDIYEMKKIENVKNNDYIIKTKKELEDDYFFFMDEVNKDSEFFDEEVYNHLKSFKVLNDKFVYLA